MKTSQRLAFIDLDGTLLGHDKTTSPANREALDHLRAAQVQIVIASGRHHRNIVSFRDIGEMSWVLSSQGAVVRHEQTGEVLHEMTMLPERVTGICARARDMKMSLIAYHRDGVYTERTTQWTELYSRNAGWMPQTADFRSLPPEGFQKIIWSGNPALIGEIAPAIKQELQREYEIVVTAPELLEFLAPGANKGAGARILAAKLGIGPENTFAFGDGNNDVELLQWAGIPVAMKHGSESARKAARFVSPDGPPDTAFARAVELALNI